jgi:TolB-like protein/Flp pilus assembly protein TadD
MQDLNAKALSRLQHFLRELRRRKVYRVAVVYVIGAVAGLELLNVLVPASRLPEWSDELFLGLAVFGFPLALVIAWAFELAPDGIRLTEPATDSPETSNFLAFAGLASLILVAAGSWWLMTQKATQSPVKPPVEEGIVKSSTERPFVAVLPLANLSPDENNAYFAAGIHEEILSQLSKVSSLGVFARTTMNQYQNPDRPITDIGRQLGATAILEGSVRRAGDRVRIAVQLIDPETQSPLWSETYERTLEDIFSVQLEIARNIAARLQATLLPEEEERIFRRATDSLAAYDLYLKGLEAHFQDTAEDNFQAVRLFQEALDLDPGYALAEAGLGHALAKRDGRFGYPHGEPAEQAIRHAQRAIELDPNLAEGYSALGRAQYARGRLQESLTAYRKALDLDRNNFDAWHGGAIVSYNLGHHDESVRMGIKASRLAPENASARSIVAHAYKFLKMDRESKQWLKGMLVMDPEDVSAHLLETQFAVYEGRSEEALVKARQVVAMNPDHAWAHTGAAGNAYVTRNYDLAIKWALRSLELEPDNNLAYWHTTDVLLGLAKLKSSGDKADRGALDLAMERLKFRVAAGERKWNLLWDISAGHAALGEVELALESLEAAYKNGFRFARWSPVDPAFDSIRGEPRYQKLMGQIEAEVTQMREHLSLTSDKQ